MPKNTEVKIYVPTYILRAIELWLLGRFHPVSFKTKRLVCVETDG